LASQPQKSVTLWPQLGGETTKSIRYVVALGGRKKKKNLNGILMFMKIVFKKVFRGDLIKLFFPLHRSLVLQIFIRTVVPVLNFIDMVTSFTSLPCWQ
jgi:hypothetical protein